MNRSTTEFDDLGLASIPLVHSRDGVDTVTLFAGEVGRGQWGVVERVYAEGDWVGDDHVCGNAGGKGRDGNGFGEHVDV